MSSPFICLSQYNKQERDKCAASITSNPFITEEERSKAAQEDRDKFIETAKLVYVDVRRITCVGQDENEEIWNDKTDTYDDKPRPNRVVIKLDAGGDHPEDIEVEGPIAGVMEQIEDALADLED